MITAAALRSLPAGAAFFGLEESEKLVKEYCLYPDLYHGAQPDAHERMRVFCEFEGKPIHHLSWTRAKDLALIRHLRGALTAAIRAGNAGDAARYAGTLAHVLEDATCPAHALMPFDSPLNLIRDLLAPPAERRDVPLHKVIEASSPEVDLAGRAPRTLDDAALLDALYAGVRSTRSMLLQVARAAYEGDEKGMDPGRRQASLTGARLLADALYSAHAAAR